MQFMSGKQFEEFLAEQFLQKASQEIKPGFRYQFKSPDNENSERLFLAMKARTNGSFITPHRAELSYIDTGVCKIIPVLHGEVDSSDYSFTENYISHLRDGIASQEGELKGCSLVIIHNSLLDTLINSADNLAAKGQVWSPECIRDALKTLVDQTNQNHEVSECLLDNQFDNILEDGATMFGFEKLFKAVEDGDLLFHELEMFDDPLITQMGKNKKQIKARLDLNRSMYQNISYEVENYGQQLLERLKEFSDSFIRKYFIDAEPDEWKQLELEELLQEKKNNAKQQLLLEGETLTSGEIIARNRSESKAGMRERHIIIELDENQNEFELKLAFKGSSDLTKSQLKIGPVNALDGSEEWTVRNSNSFKSAFATLNAQFSGKPTYFTIALKRDISSEKYSFRCLIVRKGQFYLEPFKNVFTVESQAKNQRITINTENNKLPVNPDETASYELTDTNQLVDISKYGIVDFESLANESDEIEFFLQSGDEKLKLHVEGAIANDSLPLPLLLNKGRFHKLFNDEYNGEFFAKRSKVALDNSEFIVTATRSRLLKFEQRFVEERAVCLNGEDSSTPLSEISSFAPEIEQAYQQLFSYLADKKSTPSLVSWGDEYLDLAKTIILECLDYFDSIPTSGPLSDEQRLVLKIGRVWDEDEEYYSPYHPLVMAYYVNLCHQIQSDTASSFADIPAVTLDRLVPSGLMPYSYHPTYEYSYNQSVKENAFWIKSVPQEKSTYTFVRKLVKEKIEEFQSAFNQLFDEHNNSLIINVVNLEQAEELFFGLVDYIKDNREQASAIHVNLYDDSLQFNAFDKFAEVDKYETLKSWLGLDKNQKMRETADSVIDELRSLLTYSKFTNSQVQYEGQAYAHLTFFRNNSKVDCTDVDIDDMECSVAADGLLAGEASQSIQGSYYTGFGLSNISYDDKPHLKMAKYIGSLTKPALGRNIQYHGKNAVSLAVSEDFKELLKRSYTSSVWTTIIDPKVTLDFFHSNEDVVLIHYSDQYTSSSSYDAITVTAQRHLFEKVLDHEKGGFVDEFNAFNGDWLLKMISAPTNGHKSVEQFDKLRKERRGIIGAYKFVTSMVSQSDITWVPLSVAEMIRVSGNLGLKMSDSEFSRNVNGYHKGAISDDVLLVGLKEQTLYLLPLEVKTGATPDYNKAVEQSKELGRYLTEDILGGDSLLAKLYRSLFIRQILMQVDKYRLYSVFNNGYFDALLAEKEQWLAGHYQIGQIDSYPSGFVVSHLESAACLDTNYHMQDDILRIELPMSLLDSLVSTPLKSLMNENMIKSVFHVPNEYILNIATPSYKTRENNHPIQVDIQEPKVNVTAADKTSSLQEDLNLKDSIAHCRVEIGTDTLSGEKVYWEYGNKDLANRHMIIFGSSGQGKTYCIEGLMMSLADSAINSLVIDYTSGFLPNHLEPEFVEKMDPKSNVLCIEPFAMSPFRAQKQDFGGIHVEEKPHMVAGRVASVFNKVYSSIGEKQIAVLTDVIEHGVQAYGSSYSLQNMLDDLMEEETVGPTLASKLSPLVKSNLFSSDSNKSWESVFTNNENKTTVMQLVSLSHDISMLCTEFLLWDLYSYACSYGSKNNPIPIVLDEVQNLDHRLESPLGKMLTEGRKFGVSLILATQTLSMLRKDEQDRLFQASHKLFFAPAKTETKTYAKILELSVPGTKQTDWENQLADLDKGQCLSVGYHLDRSGCLKMSVKKVMVTAMGSRK